MRASVPLYLQIWRGWNQHVFGLLATATAYDTLCGGISLADSTEVRPTAAGA